MFGPFKLDPARRLLKRDGAPVTLTPTVFDTLLHLVENPGRVVSKEELLDAIWPGRLVEESNISQTIFTLRKALGGAGDEDRLIVTAPGRGYRFVPMVRLEGASEAPEARAPPDPRGESRRRAPFRLVPALLALALVLGGLAFWFRPWRAPDAVGARGVVVQAEFQNLTREPIFDRTLGKVLEIDLGQSPFLIMLSDRQVQDTLILMTRSKDAPLTVPLAREVCARNNGRAVVEGGIAAMGATYLITLTASNCAGDQILAAEKIQVDKREAVVPALDRLIDRMRGKLGESARSIRRFDVPLLKERTASLEALKAYSEAALLHSHGHLVEAIPLYQHAIQLDPDFAAAYASLSSVYTVLNKTDLDILNITKAYALRDSVSERLKFHIISRYQYSVTKNLTEAISNLQVWSETYPDDATAWTNLANLEDVVGRSQRAIEDGKRALALNPGRESAYVVLAQAYRRAGQPDQAKAIAEAAVARGLAGDFMHNERLRIALARHDGDGAAREVAWARGRLAERDSLVTQAEVALGQGKVRQAMALFDRAVELGRQRQLPDIVSALRARYLVEFGLTDQARDLLAGPGEDAGPQDYLFTLAEVGDPARARSILDRDLRQGPADTLLNDIHAPEVRAALALRRGQAKVAVDVLQSTRPYGVRDFEAPYLLGRAYLAAGNGGLAAREFGAILDHQGVYPASPLYPLARLGLARAYRLEGDVGRSRFEYKTFLDAWKGADPDLPVMRAARTEYARM